ncbi:MAG: hypothetical protein DMD99_10205 [Candidatus Rokuibacteriota bacterium]|nr:MAG: hypothetical protein DMD99_10205 [Candidatus Rokubacteria bacterium]
MSRKTTETSTVFFTSSVAGDELRQLALELLEELEPLARLLEALEGGLQLLVLRRQLGVGLVEP